jgi:nucleotide-binding universal stress UspA family protein
MSHRSDRTHSEVRGRDRPRRLLVPFDGGERSERALSYACAAFPGDDIVALYVLTRENDEAAARGWVDAPEAFAEWAAARRNHAERTVFAAARRIADRYDRSVATELAVGGVVRGVVDYWNTHDVDFLVMDVRGRGRRRVLDYLTGDASARLTRTSAIPAVLVTEDVELPAEARSANEHRRLLVPFDESARSRNALAFACSLFPDAAITVLCMAVVWGSESTFLLDQSDARDERMTELAATAERIASEHDVTVTTTFGYGALDRATTQFVDANPVDLVVAGTLGPATLTEHVLPSASERLVRNCPLPIAVVPSIMSR